MSDHVFCAFSGWKKDIRIEQLEAENAGLKAELEQLKKKAQEKVKKNADRLHPTTTD